MYLLVVLFCVITRSSVYRESSLTVPLVRFNTCSTVEPNAYETLILEAGHALGIRGRSFGSPYRRGHSALKDSVMNYNGSTPLPGFRPSFREPDCSPHPLDIMAIHALYQTLPE